MSSNRWREFRPPEKGLNEGETVEWSQKAGVEFNLIFCGSCLPLASFFFAFPIIFFLGQQVGTAVLVALGVMIVYYFGQMIRRKMTKYFLTSERLLEVRGGIIEAEIPLVNLRGLDSADFLTTSLSHDDGPYNYYNIDIADPVQGTNLRMTAMREDVLEIVRGLGDLG
ncbi:hypothetical protein EU538_03975 [Candidatus Thorarchaeota archaeon]|nr:MAG: hypothetical protein EU538_03975 [Candidatus Thorarchaeota archaeon]